MLIILFYFICFSNDFETAFSQITQANLWTTKRVQKLQKAYLDVPHTPLCFDLNNLDSDYKVST